MEQPARLAGGGCVMPNIIFHEETLAAASRALEIQRERAGIDPATAIDLQALKVVEELGEAVAALIGMVGQNPRKGVTHTEADLLGELFDVALTAYVAAVTVQPHLLDSGPGGLGVTVAVPMRRSDLALALARIVEASGGVGAAILVGDEIKLAEALHRVATVALTVAASLTDDVEAEYTAHAEAKVGRLVEAVEAHGNGKRETSRGVPVAQ